MEILEREVMPAKQHWSLRGLARYLQSDCKTIKKYDALTQQVLPAYRMFALNQQAKGYSPYRAWVLIQVIKLSRLIAEDMAGTRFDFIVRNAVVKNAQHLTPEAFRVYTNYQEN